MATFIVNANANIDTLAGKTGDDTINVNNATLTIDQDSRYGANQNTSATLGNITLSATLGGTLSIDARYVRLIPYNTGSGNVPASGTTITQGSASGTLIGVWSAINVAPTAAGSPMPASGFIKIKAWNQTAYAAGALTGIGANATGADVPGWITLVGTHTRAITGSRLNTITFRGDYFQVGTTDGNNATTYQLPTSGETMYYPGVYVETGSATNVYEFYPNASGILATATGMATDSLRGKVCWINTSGVVRFNNDGTNTTGGWLPPTGRRIRIPNIICQEATIAAPTVNAAPNATITDRYEFITTGAPAVDITHFTGVWYLNLTQAYSVNIADSIAMTRILLSKVVGAPTLTRVAVGSWDTTDNAPTGTLAINTCQAGGTITDCHFSRSTWASNAYALNVTDSFDWTITNTAFRALIARTGTTVGGHINSRSQRFTFTNCSFNGQSFLSYIEDFTLTNSIYWDTPVGKTVATNPNWFVNQTGGKNVVIDGFSLGGITGSPPYSGIYSPGSGAINCYMRNIGTYASPVQLGGDERIAKSWSRSGTTITVTDTNHGLGANGTTTSVYIRHSSDATAALTATRTATIVDANTWTYTGANAGATSGTLNYFDTISGYIFQISNGSAVNGFYANRIYAIGTRQGLHTTDNSSLNISLKDLQSDLANAFTPNTLNTDTLNTNGIPSLVGQSAVYGTHWFASNILRIPTSLTGTWTRSGTSVTVTSAGHGMRANAGAVVFITVSSDEAALPLGNRTLSANIMTDDTFVLTGVATGATSGTCTFEIGTSRIGVFMNEPTALTTSQVTTLGGNPRFTSTGTLSMPTINDEIRFTSPEIKGQSAFVVAQLQISGGTISNHDVFYQINKLDGNGWLSERPLNVNRYNSSTTSGSAIVTVSSTTGLAAGDYVFASQFPHGTTISSVDSATQLTMSRNATSTSTTATLAFNRLPTETVPNTGFQFRWRVITTVANSAAITNLWIHTRNTATDRQQQYPLPLPVTTLEVTNLAENTQVVLFDESDWSELQRTTVGIDGVFTYEYLPAEPFPSATVLIYHPDYKVIKLTGIELNAEDNSLYIVQEADLIYDSAATDRYTINWSTQRINMNTGQTTMEVPGVYSYWKDELITGSNAQYALAFTVEGGTDLGGGKFIPPYVFQSTSWKIKPDEASHTLSVVDGILIGESSSDPFTNTTGAYTVRVKYEQPVQAIALSTSGGSLTASDVWSHATRTLTAIGSSGIASETNATSNRNTIQTDIANLNDISSADVTAAVPTVNQIADGVWDEALSGHATQGTAGQRLTKAAKKANTAANK